MPKELYKKPIGKENEMNKFLTKVHKFPINKIIFLDDTSVGSALKPHIVALIWVIVVL